MCAENMDGRILNPSIAGSVPDLPQVVCSKFMENSVIVNSLLQAGIIAESSISWLAILTLDAKGRPYKVWVLQPCQRLERQFDGYMETATYGNFEGDRKVWFSMWFLGAIVTFGLAFFPMYYRLVEGRNKHFRHNADWEERVVAFQKGRGKELTVAAQNYAKRNALAWAVSIILIVPAFVVLYFLSRDLIIHELNEDEFLASAFPKKIFMPQSVPIKTYVIVTIATLGIGGVYWLYRVVNLYNAHYQADLQVEREIAMLMEQEEHV